MSSSSDPIIDLIPAPIRPTLPTELIEEILGQPSLSKSDLASCCRVSQQFLNPARRSLYFTVTVDVTSLPTSGQPRFVLTERTLLLLGSLRSSSTLRGLVISLCCEMSYRPPRDEISYSSSTLSWLVKDLLDSLPRIDGLYLRHDAFESLQDYALLVGNRWSNLQLRHIVADHGFTAASPFPNLRRLECRDLLALDNTQHHFLPPHLTHLDLVSISYPSKPIVNAASSPLHFLRISGVDLVENPEFSRLPRIHHLEISRCEGQLSFFRKVVETLNRYRALKSLTLNGMHVTESEVCLDLFNRLPGSLTQLDVFSPTPLECMIAFVDRGSTKSIRTLGLSEEDFGEEQKKDDLKRLRETCERREIQLVAREQDISIFDM